MFQKCSFCPTLQIRGLLERSHSSHPTTVRAVNERLIRHAQGSPSGSLSPGAIGLCRPSRNSPPLLITTHSTYKAPGRPAHGSGVHRSHPHRTAQRPMTAALSPTLSGAVQASVLLTNPFHRQGDLYFFGSRPQVHGDTEVRQFELGASLKTLTVTTPGIFTTAQALGVDYHILGHS